MYSLLIALIYLAFISLGLPDSLLGAGWPTMYGALGVPLSYMGIITMIISGGTVLSSLASDRFTRRFGTRGVMVTSVCLTAVALYGFSFSSRFWMLALWAIPYGLGAGAIDAALNNYVALHYTSRHMSWLHCFWGVGAIISPYVMSRAIATSVWNDGYRAVAFIQTAIAVVLLCTLPVWKVNQQKGGEAVRRKGPGVAAALRIKGVPSLLLGFLCYGAVETVTMFWTSSYLVGVRGVSEELAAAFAALFYIGLTAGRFMAGFVTDRLGDRNMIRLGTAILFCGILCEFIPLQTDTLALAGFVVIGLGCAPIYPSIIHSTPGNFGAENSGAIIGIQMASAYIGTVFVPPLFGVVAKYTGLGILPACLTGFAVLMICMLEKTFSLTGGAARRER